MTTKYSVNFLQNYNGAQYVVKTLDFPADMSYYKYAIITGAEVEQHGI